MKNNRKVKSPSKYISLERLELIQTNNYIGETGQEYCAEEVDSLIWQKQSNNDEREVESLLRRFEEY